MRKVNWFFKKENTRRMAGGGGGGEKTNEKNREVKHFRLQWGDGHHPGRRIRSRRRDLAAQAPARGTAGI